MAADMEFEFEENQRPENWREKMNQESSAGNLVDTTDCLEAVSVIRCWKNMLFVIILLGLLLLQIFFWMMNLKLVKADEPGQATKLLGLVAEANSPAAPASDAATAEDKIKQAAKEAVGDTNALVSGPSQPARPFGLAQGGQSSPQAAAEPNQPQQIEVRFWFEPKIKHITAMVRFLNFILIPGAVLYCLSLLFSFKLSLIGRLGGINHIARAFFLSLVFVVLLLPWQLMFAPVFAGAMFTPTELINACQAQKTTPALVSFYLRFTGYWLLVLLVLLAAQIRSMRWAKTTLRRLEVV
jgi:hypothetical protein